jgi:hypothetical protein
MKESIFVCELYTIILGYMGYHTITVKVFGLVWFVDFSVVQCVAVLKVFVGGEACCLAVSHNSHL